MSFEMVGSLKIRVVENTDVDTPTFSVLPEKVSGYNRIGQLAKWCSDHVDMLAAADSADIATTVAIYRHLNLNGQSSGNLWYGISYLRDIIDGTVRTLSSFDDIWISVGDGAGAVTTTIPRTTIADISPYDELVGAKVDMCYMGGGSRPCEKVIVSVYGNKTKTLITAVVMDNDPNLVDNFANRWFALQMHVRIRPDLYGCKNVFNPYPFGFRIGAVARWYESYTSKVRAQLQNVPNSAITAHRSAMDIMNEYSLEKLLKLDPTVVAQFESNYIGKDIDRLVNRRLAELRMVGCLDSNLS